MIEKVMHFIINSAFFVVIVIVVGIIATINLTTKINTYEKQSVEGVTGTVKKEQIPVMSYTGGFIQSIEVRTGQLVKKGDLIAKIDNPTLRGKVTTLRQYPSNVSAQTEANVAEIQLSFSDISAPTDGIVGEILVKEQSPVEEYTTITSIYTYAHTRILSYVTPEQLKLALSQKNVSGFSTRLNQEIVLVPDILDPVESSTNESNNEKKIGLYFLLSDAGNSASLLDNEDLNITLSPRINTSKKPVDYIVSFWNNILETSTKPYVATR
jgi:hypothetical protein